VDAGLFSWQEARQAAEVMEASLRDKRSRTTEMRSEFGGIYSVSCSPLETGGGVALFEDVTEKYKAQEHIDQLAHYDSLTGLMNRYRMHSEIDRVIDTMPPDGKAAIMFLDLDKFKQVNDTLGHPVGDALLCSVAERLATLLPPQAKLGRLGGDEFIILMERYDTEEELSVLADDVIEQLRHPIQISGQRLQIGVSIGIASVPRDAATTDALIKCADVALYCSKSAGRGRWHFFQPEMQEAALARRKLELDLRHAVENETLCVRFQPLVDSNTLRITTCEALVRWEHPERGSVSPAEFIPVAEETGLIDKIGPFVMRKACAAAASWPGKTRVAVNVSALQFQGDIEGVVMDALAESGLAPNRLEIEITESVFLQSSDLITQQLDTLRDIGVRVALDDFGTGYSSLSYLHSFPLDKVKLDRSFLQTLHEDKQSEKLLEGVINLCKTLELNIVIEGIETPAQLEKCTELGHEGELQGFLFGAALPSERIAQFLTAQSPDKRVVEGAHSIRAS
jgi:diguanylate cyclase (GGDEF)-like protein